MAPLRRRTKKGKPKDAKAKKEETPVVEEAGVPKGAPVTGDETMWQVFTRHPFVQVVFVFMIPYLLYTGYYYVQLQRPDILNGIGIPLRPAVDTTGERQVLIVGTMSSGTVQVASDLSQLLGLEVGHESADTSWNFVRDGTVSWFHGIRFLDPPKNKAKAYSQLCFNYTGNMGFRPHMYGGPCDCSTRSAKWDNCWAKQCIMILEQEWGCHKNCTTPFRSNLHQVRHPLKTITSLVTKFCQGGLNGTTHPSFLTYASALFPDHDYETDNCIEATSHYVLEYNNAMLKAKAKGSIDHVYQVEKTSPCQVAEMAGFVADAVYAPNSDITSTQCQQGVTVPVNQPMISTRHKINVDLLELTWDDFKGGMHSSVRKAGDSALEQKVKDLTRRLGYEE